MVVLVVLKLIFKISCLGVQSNKTVLPVLTSVKFPISSNKSSSWPPSVQSQNQLLLSHQALSPSCASVPTNKGYKNEVWSLFWLAGTAHQFENQFKTENLPVWVQRPWIVISQACCWLFVGPFACAISILICKAFT